MDRRRRHAPYPRHYVAEWSSKALHGTALMLNRLSEEQDLSRQQEWLWLHIVEELEYRYLEAIRRAPWTACSCALCFSPFPMHDPVGDGGYESDDPRQSRPDGAGISRKPPHDPARHEATDEDPNHQFNIWEYLERPAESEPNRD